jgi:hypothetical protein
MKKVTQWEKPNLGVIARNKTEKTACSSRKGGAQYYMGPLPPAYSKGGAQHYLGPVPSPYIY